MNKETIQVKIIPEKSLTNKTIIDSTRKNLLKHSEKSRRTIISAIVFVLVLGISFFVLMARSNPQFALLACAFGVSLFMNVFAALTC